MCRVNSEFYIVCLFAETLKTIVTVKTLDCLLVNCIISQLCCSLIPHSWVAPSPIMKVTVTDLLIYLTQLINVEYFIFTCLDTDKDHSNYSTIFNNLLKHNFVKPVTNKKEHHTYLSFSLFSFFVLF